MGVVDGDWIDTIEGIDAERNLDDGGGWESTIIKPFLRYYKKLPKGGKYV